LIKLNAELTIELKKLKSEKKEQERAIRDEYEE
jgi:hypothetical protein